VKDYQIINRGYHYGVGLNTTISSTDPVNQEIIAYRGGASLERQDQPTLMLYRGQAFNQYRKVDLGKGFGDVHQMACANQGVFLTNTAFNSLVFFDFEEDLTQKFIFDDAETDQNHVNSVLPFQGKVIVVLHNRGKKESEIVVLAHSRGTGFVVEERKSLWHLGCHNIYLDHDFLYYNASRKHELFRINLDDSSQRQGVHFPGWHTKGLSVDQDFLVIGLSEHTLREKRSTARGKLAVVDRNRFKIVTTIDLNFPELPHPVGNINEVRCISGEELGHDLSETLEIKWSQVDFLDDQPVRLWALRLKTFLMLPLRRIKAKLFGWA
jgi:hypothetical protein